MNEHISPRARASTMNRREGLAIGAGGLLAAAGLALQSHAAQQEKTMSTDAAIRPFRVSFPDAALADLKRRVGATIWPERETVPDASQGVRLATMKALAAHWVNEYDWRRIETRINSFPNFITEID